MAAKSTRPSRFPVTRFEVVNDQDQQAGNPSVVVLDDCDKDFGEDRPHQDALTIIHESGNQGDARTVSFKEFNTCQTIGAKHCVALDAARGRIYLCELVGGRVTALDVRGRKLWQVDKIQANALAVDPRTGDLWCTGGKDLVDGETVVLDTTGREVMSFSVRGTDIAYDPHSDGFWLVGSEITKLSREGKVLFHKPPEGWACVSVAANARDGSVWIVERKHLDVARSVNRLWHLDANGAPIKTWELEDKVIFGACNPRTGWPGSSTSGPSSSASRPMARNCRRHRRESIKLALLSVRLNHKDCRARPGRPRAAMTAEDHGLDHEVGQAGALVSRGGDVRSRLLFCRGLIRTRACASAGREMPLWAKLERLDLARAIGTGRRRPVSS